MAEKYIKRGKLKTTRPKTNTRKNWLLSYTTKGKDRKLICTKWDGKRRLRNTSSQQKAGKSKSEKRSQMHMMTSREKSCETVDSLSDAPKRS